MKACCSHGSCKAWAFVQEYYTACLINFGGALNCSATATGAKPNVITGGSRASVPRFPPHFDFSTRTFDDSRWELVDAPHDCVINGTFNETNDDIHHGFLERPVCW